MARGTSEWRPPRPDQLARGDGHNARNQKQEYRDRQVGLLLEFFEAFIDLRRSPEEDRAYEEENGDCGSKEGDDFEDHCPRQSCCAKEPSPPNRSCSIRGVCARSQADATEASAARAAAGAQCDARSRASGATSRMLSNAT